VEELSRDDVSALAGEVLEALGVEKVEMDGEDQEAVKRAVEAWRAAKDERI
jgi:transketolase N-terminal domain/subunit